MAIITNNRNIWGTMGRTYWSSFWYDNKYVSWTAQVLVGVDNKSRDVVQRKKPKGFKPPTSYSSSGVVGSTSGFPVAYAYGVYGGKYSIGVGADNSGPGDLSSLPSFDESVANKAIIGARLNLKGQKINVAVAFNERKQTANLISSTATRVAKAIKAVKKGNLRDLRNAIGITRASPWPKGFNKKQSRMLAKKAKGGDKDAAHQLWLEHRFGWMPLLSDVHGAAEALAEADLADPQRYSFSVKRSASTSYGSSGTASKDQLAFGAFPRHVDWRIKGTMGAMVRFDAFMENPALQQAAALGLTNPLAIAWEAVPFSFVADWFVPIGNYVNAMDATLGWNFRAGSISRRIKQKGTASQRARYDYPEWKNLTVSGYASCQSWSLQRSVLTSFPYPATIFPKNPLSTSHVVSALALLRQVFR